MQNLRLVNEEAILNDWTSLLQEQTGIEDKYKLNWMSKMCNIQTLNESSNSLINESYSYGAYASLSSTPGMGSIVPPSTHGTPQNFYSTGTQGSGDKFPTLLPLAIQVAARTVGFDVVSVIPMNSPVTMLAYMDYVYAGGKLDSNTAPILIKINAAKLNAGATDFTVGAAYWGVGAADTSALSATPVVQLAFVGYSKIDGYPIFRVGSLGVDTTTSFTANTTTTIALVFDGTLSCIVTNNGGGTSFTYPTNTATGANIALTNLITGSTYAQATLVRAFEDHISGPTGAGEDDTDTWNGPWEDGTSTGQPMSRETGETTYYRPLGVKLFSKTIAAKTFQASALVTQELIQDLNKQWSIDVVSMLENALINEISQSINKNILKRLFALGWSNNYEMYTTEGITLNFTLDRNKAVGSTATYIDKLGASQAIPYLAWQDFGDFENQATLHNRIKAKVLAASNVIQQRSRRGQATFIVTNLQIATALQVNAQYTFAPINNNINQGGGLYPLGQVCGMTVYVDPNMKFGDNRILVGRKGADDEPGVKFCPYLMAETIQTISEGTMGPKIAVKSRYALVEAGHWPETVYYTIYVDTPSQLII